MRLYGCTEAILLAHGFASDLIASIASLVRAGLATAQIERAVAGAPSKFAKSLLICPNGRTPPHPQIDRVLHAGRCRRHDRLGDRWRTNRGPLAGASARITEMTRRRQVCLAGKWRLRPRRTATGCIEPSRGNKSEILPCSVPFRCVRRFNSLPWLRKELGIEDAAKAEESYAAAKLMPNAKR
jgi:hypothetical protein